MQPSSPLEELAGQTRDREGALAAYRPALERKLGDDWVEAKVQASEGK